MQSRLVVSQMFRRIGAQLLDEGTLRGAAHHVGAQVEAPVLLALLLGGDLACVITLRVAAILETTVGAFYAGEVAFMALHQQMLPAPRRVVTILFVASQTPLEGHTRVDGDLRKWVCEAAVACVDVRVPACAVIPVVQGSGDLVDRRELLGGIRTAIHFGQETSRLVLLAGSAQLAETSVVVVDVGVAPAAISLVAQSVDVLNEVGLVRLDHRSRLLAELAVARLIPVAGKHLNGFN